MKQYRYLFIIMLSLFLIFSACNIPPISPEVKGIQADSKIILVGENTFLTCIIDNPGNDSLDFTWQCNSGSFNGNGNTVQFFPPDTCGTYTITCTVNGTFIKNNSPTIDIMVSDKIFTPEMIFVESGSFTMGDVVNENRAEEKPTHVVTLDDYYIAKYEVTIDEYIRFLNVASINDVYGEAYSHNNLLAQTYVLPGGPYPERTYYPIWYFHNEYLFIGSPFADSINCAVNFVSWYGAVEYCNWLSRLNDIEEVYHIEEGSVIADFTKNGYRLPTEAEWEYAARSRGREDRRWSGFNYDSLVYNYANTQETILFSGKLKPVGSYEPNELGVYDMTGNVWEWCWDLYSDYTSSDKINPTGPTTGEKHVFRGGSWVYPLFNIQNFRRECANPGWIGSSSSGFRIAKNTQQ